MKFEFCWVFCIMEQFANFLQCKHDFYNLSNIDRFICSPISGGIYFNYRVLLMK